MDKNANRIILQNIARKAMIARGLEPDFPSAVDAELSKITSPAINKTSLAKEWKLVKGYGGLKVGQKLKVRLIQINVEAGFIDFERV